jgi:L-threonylcarbamoyladenylate synthase
VRATCPGMPRGPRVLAVEPHAPPEVVAPVAEEAANVLRRGGLVALPTETVYGLGARALDARALARVYAAKGRPTHHPLIAHVFDEAAGARLAAFWPERASRLAREFWPGPLTLVVDRAAHVPAAAAGGGASLAVRSPSHPIARAILAALGEPIAAPSANRYQGLSPTTAAHVVKELGDAVDLVVDGGPCEAGIESTVIDVRGHGARVLRPGALDVAAVRAILPELQAGHEEAAGDEPRASPGMDARHYAPRAPLMLAASREGATALASELASRGGKVGLVVRGACTALPASVVVRELRADPAGYARLLYGVLHDLDDAGVESIVVERVPTDEAWWAVADRLQRAAVTTSH